MSDALLYEFTGVTVEEYMAVNTKLGSIPTEEVETGPLG